MQGNQDHYQHLTINIANRPGVVFIAPTQLLSTKPELRFNASSALGVSKICDSESLRKWSWQERIFLTHFNPILHFHTSWKRRFLTFSGGIEMWQWTKMGEHFSLINYFAKTIRHQVFILWHFSSILGHLMFLGFIAF